MSFRSAVSLLILMLLVYPLALAVQAGTDSMIGDGAFFDALLHGRKRVLALQVLDDALAALPIIAALFAALFVLAFCARGRPVVKKIYWLAVLVFLAAPAVPMVPLFAGTVCFITGAFMALWSWRALA
jgi:hypothetical protein